MHAGEQSLFIICYILADAIHAQQLCDTTPSLTGQIHFQKKREGLVNCVHTLCPAALYSAVQSYCNILSHDALHHCLSSNSSLEDGERELGRFPHYCRTYKNTLTILLREHAYSATGYLRVQFLKSAWLSHLANCILVDTACIHSSPGPSLFSRSGSGS